MNTLREQMAEADRAVRQGYLDLNAGKLTFAEWEEYHAQAERRLMAVNAQITALHKLEAEGG